jgi:uncharacterized protein YdaT
MAGNGRKKSSSIEEVINERVRNTSENQRAIFKEWYSRVNEPYTKRDVHVIRSRDGWVVRREGSERASSVHSTQRQAIDAARPIARRERAEVFTHGTDGRIRYSDSYGRDPNPPKDKKH